MKATILLQRTSSLQNIWW